MIRLNYSTISKHNPNYFETTNFTFIIIASVSEIRSDELYTVGFTSGGRTFKIDVLLTPAFPDVRPQLILSPSIEHPWVNGPTGEIENAPGLLNVSKTHYLLWDGNATLRSNLLVYCTLRFGPSGTSSYSRI